MMIHPYGTLVPIYLPHRQHYKKDNTRAKFHDNGIFSTTICEHPYHPILKIAGLSIALRTQTTDIAKKKLM